MKIVSVPLGRFERLRADVAEEVVDSDSLVPHPGSYKDCRTHLVVRVETLIVDELLLQGRPETSIMTLS